MNIDTLPLTSSVLRRDQLTFTSFLRTLQYQRIVIPDNRRRIQVSIFCWSMAANSEILVRRVPRMQPTIHLFSHHVSPFFPFLFSNKFLPLSSSILCVGAARALSRGASPALTWRPHQLLRQLPRPASSRLGCQLPRLGPLQRRARHLFGKALLLGWP
jgi:hypothetical protein